MKKNIAVLLCVILLLSAMPISALAAKVQISFAGKVGFMYLDGETTLKPKLKNATMSDLSWESSDPEVVRVSAEGKLHAVGVGRAVVTASCGSVSGRCGIVVLPKSIELDVGDQYRLPYGTVEKYAVQHNSIAQISSKGVIEALREGSTYIRVKSKHQTMFIKLKVAGEETVVDQSKAAGLDCAGSTNQIVLVEHESGSTAKLSIHEKTGGVWKELYACTAYIGRNGIGKTKEGDRRTPTGTYNLTQPFGIKADPGANMDYTQVTKYHYWCGTSGSDYYNQMIDMREVDRKYTSSDEYLINYKGEYNYCMFIDYNRKGEAGKGSCIFLHCTGNKKYTAGCIAVPEKVMKKIVQWAKPGAKIVIQ